MNLRRVALVVCVAAGLWPSIRSGAQEPGGTGTLAVTGATVIDAAGGPPAVRTVVIRDGVVAAVQPSEAPVPEAAQVIDGRGRFLIPGLWDMHAHLAIRPEPELAERVMLPLYVAHGVVGVRDMGGPPDRLLSLRAAAAAGGAPVPRIITPGPFLDGPGDDSPMFRRVLSPPDAAAALRDLSAAGVDFFKVQSALSAEAHAAVMREARARGSVVAGHVPLAMTAAEVAASGQRSIEHISPALVADAGLLFACSNREDELRAELLAIERDRPSAAPGTIAARERTLRHRLVETFDAARARTLGARLKTAGTWVVPTLIWSNSLRPLTPEDDGSRLPMEFVPAATRTRWMQNRARYIAALAPADFAAAAEVARVSAAAVKALHEGGAAVLAGTDASTPSYCPASACTRNWRCSYGPASRPLPRSRQPPCAPPNTAAPPPPKAPSPPASAPTSSYSTPIRSPTSPTCPAFTPSSSAAASTPVRISTPCSPAPGNRPSRRTLHVARSTEQPHPGSRLCFRRDT